METSSSPCGVDHPCGRGIRQVPHGHDPVALDRNTRRKCRRAGSVDHATVLDQGVQHESSLPGSPAGSSPCYHRMPRDRQDDHHIETPECITARGGYALAETGDEKGYSAADRPCVSRCLQVLLDLDLCRSAPCHGPTHRLFRIPLPAEDPLGPVHEKRGEATDPMAEDLPDSGWRLRIDQANHHPVAIPTAHGANPVGDAEELLSNVLRILVDLLRMHLPADPRSFQERLAVGSVREAAQHRRHDIHADGSHGTPSRSPGSRSARMGDTIPSQKRTTGRGDSPARGVRRSN